MPCSTKFSMTLETSFLNLTSDFIKQTIFLRSLNSVFIWKRSLERAVDIRWQHAYSRECCGHSNATCVSVRSLERAVDIRMRHVNVDNSLRLRTRKLFPLAAAQLHISSNLVNL